MQNNEIEILDAVVIVQIDVRASNLSGSVNPVTDYKGADIPPEEVVSGGVRHFIDPKKKQWSNTARKAMERACDEVGIRLERGWAVPVAKARELKATLKEIELKFVTTLNVFIQDLPNAYAEWELANPKWVHLIQRDRPTPDAIRGKYRCKHRMWRMKPAADDENDELNEDMGLASSLSERILEELAKFATETYEKKFNGKLQVSGKVIPPIGAMADKLLSFAAIDPFVIPVVEMIGDILQTIGTSSDMLSVVETQSLRSLVLIMADPEKVRSFGASHFAGGQEEPEGSEIEATQVAADSDVNGVLLLNNSPATVVDSTEPVEETSEYVAVCI